MPEEKPKIIYHYTSQSGLLGILNKKALRATDLLYLNDYSEFQHTVDIAKRALTTLADIAKGKLLIPTSDSISRVIGNVNERDLPFFDNVIEILGTLDRHHIYTFSFSEAGDSLSQWKLYGSDFRGFSIGFSLSELEAYGDVEGGFFVQKCLYDEQVQVESILGILAMALNTYREDRDLHGQLYADHADAAKICGSLLLGDLSRLKKSGFAPEKEWRIVRHYDQNYEQLNRSNPEFRESGLSCSI